MFIIILFCLVVIGVVYILIKIYYKDPDPEGTYLKKYYKSFGLESMDELFDRLGIKKIIECNECKKKLTAIYNKDSFIKTMSSISIGGKRVQMNVFDRCVDGTENMEEFKEKLDGKMCSMCEKVISVNNSLDVRLNHYSTDENNEKIKYAYPYQECKIGMIYLCECCDKGYCVNCMNPTFVSKTM